MKRFRNFSLWLVLWTVAPGIYAQAQARPAMQSAYGEKIHIDGVPNAGKINEHRYRGAQPKPTAMMELKKLGTTTVVDLRREDNQTMDVERAQAEAQGLHFVNIHVGRFSSPANEQVVQLLLLFRDHSDQTVFVHCHYGEDRTGPSA
jgi:protein tyrosine/serine phosphatase